MRLGGVSGQPADRDAQTVDQFEVGQRLAAAGEHELALRAYLRAALDQGMSGDVLVGLGTSNLALGRLGQAEDQLTRATELDPTNIAAWNNLGVLLMENGQPGPARGVFQHVAGMDGGDTAQIRANLQLAIAQSENSASITPEAGDYVLIRKGGGTYTLAPNRDGSQG